MNAIVEQMGSQMMMLVLAGFLTETVVEILKQFLVKQKLADKIIYLISIIVGLVIVYSLKISLFSNENIVAYYVGMVICGLLASRGANYIHNWFAKIPFQQKKD